MTSRCIPILEEHGPLLGSELQKLLVVKFDMKPATARKAIEREYTNNLILSTKPVHFLHRQFMYYLPGQSISKKLETVLPDYKKSANRVLQSLLHNGGLLLKEEVIKVGAATMSKRLFSSNETADELMSSLKGLNIVTSPVIHQNIKYVQLSTSFTNKEIDRNRQLFGRIRELHVNRLFIKWFIQWLQHQNMIGWNSEFNEEGLYHTEFNDQLWDAVCFTYLYGFYRKREDKKVPSPVLIEANVARILYEEDVEGFITRFKMQDARFQTAVYGERILPIIVANQISKRAFDLIKEEGIMTFQIERLLGKNVNQLISFLKNPWSESDVEKTTHSWIEWIEENQYKKYMAEIFDELHFIKTANEMKENGYSMHLHKRIIYQSDEYTIDWSLVNQKTKEVVVLISDHQCPTDIRKEWITSYFLESSEVKPEFYSVIDKRYE